jgi:hypothetical protein
MAFPSSGNYCHKAKPVAPVSREHQEGYCLSGYHVACPVFLAGKSTVLPAPMSVPPSRWKQARVKLRTPIIATVVVMYYLLAAWFTGGRAIAQRMSLFNLPVSTGPTQPGPVTNLESLPVLSADNRPTVQPLPSATPQVEVKKAVECPVPQGWKATTLQPTDSLFRLSVLYGIDEEALRKANCLDANAFLFSGSLVYVPILEPVVSATATPPPVSLAPVPQPVSDSGDEAPPAAQPAPVSPTNPPSTQVDKPKTTGHGTEIGKGNNTGKQKDKDKNNNKGKGKGNK